MKITSIPQYKVGFFSNPEISQTSSPQNNQEDCFESSRINNQPKEKTIVETIINLVKNILKFIQGIFIDPSPVYEASPLYQDKKPDKFHISLQESVKSDRNIDIPATNFMGILSPQEFENTLRQLETDNFIASDKNVREGIYCADLDCDSFSKEKTAVDILDDIKRYADQNYEKTQKDFVFALADKESVEGAKSIIEAIAKDPEKYKHVKFVPAIKLSYLHPIPDSNDSEDSKNPENSGHKYRFKKSDVIVYGINPYSKYLSELLEQSHNAKIKLLNEYRYFCLEHNLQGIKDVECDPKNDDIFERIMYNFKNCHDVKGKEKMQKKIDETFEDRYAPTINEKGEVKSPVEISFEDIINCIEFEKPEEQNLIVALASPFYTNEELNKNTEQQTNEVQNIDNFFKNLESKVEKRGIKLAFQSVVPSHMAEEEKEKDFLNRIKTFNAILRKLNRTTTELEVGGSYDYYSSFAADSGEKDKQRRMITIPSLLATYISESDKS